MMAHDDSRYIVEALADRWPELVDYLYPGAVSYRGRVYPSAKSARDLGSFEIVVEGPRAPAWYRHSEGVGGSCLHLIAYATTGSVVVTRETFDYARRFLGIDTSAPLPRRPRPLAQDARKQEAERQEAADRERRQNTAHEVWQACRPINGTAAELYLHNRGLYLTSYPDALRFHPALRHPEGETSPALVCRVDNAEGQLVGVWRIFITPTGQKAPYPDVKLGLGPVAGGAVRLFPAINGEIGIAEGVETALAVHVLTAGRVAMWAGLSTSGLRGFQPPFEIERVRCFPDGDIQKRDKDGNWRPAPGPAAALALKERLDADQIDCVIEPPPRHGRDYLDILTSLQRDT